MFRKNYISIILCLLFYMAGSLLVLWELTEFKCYIISKHTHTEDLITNKYNIQYNYTVIQEWDCVPLVYLLSTKYTTYPETSFHTNFTKNEWYNNNNLNINTIMYT